MFECFMFYFSFIFFTMVYSVEQNTFIVVFLLSKWKVYKQGIICFYK
jgi:hypothetical protein